MADTTTVFFQSGVLAPKDASVLFRSALGGITCLRDSLLGNRPKVFKDNGGFELKYHQMVRKFYDAETLRLFVKYLSGLIHDLPNPRPRLESGDECPISYTTASTNASIRIDAKPEGWIVSGAASFRDPAIAVKILSKLDGLTVTFDAE